MDLEPVNYPSVLSASGWAIADDYDPAALDGEWSVDDVRLNRTYTVQLKMFTSDKYAGPAQAIGAIGLNLGSTYQFPAFSAEADATENDTGSFLQSIRVRRASEQDTRGGMMWTASLSYAPFDVWHQLGNSDISQGLINPLDRYPEVYWDSAKYERHKVEDESTPDPLPYLNTVGDPLLDPPSTEETRPTLTFVRNESTFNDDYAAQFKDTVNSDVFLGYPPNTAKCGDIKGERVYDPDWGDYFKVRYEIEFRDDDDGYGYTYLVRNAGYRQLVGGTGSPVNVVDANGSTVTDAVPLTESGEYVPAAEPYYLQFALFPAVEFAGLNIPDNVLDAQS